MTARELEEKIENLEDASRNMRTAMRDSETFWITMYYARLVAKDPKRKFEATVVKWLKQDAGIAIVSFTETGLERRVKVDKRTRLGSAVNMRVKEAEPFRDRLSFVQVR